MAENMSTNLSEVVLREETNVDMENFQTFEDEIRELVCPQMTRRVSLRRTLSCDLEKIQAEEILALKAIFEDDLRMVDETTAKYFKIKINPISEVCSDDEVVDLWFCLPMEYPLIPPIFEIEGHGALSSAKAEDLYCVLSKEASFRLNSLMIYDLITIAQDFVHEAMMEYRRRKMAEQFKSKETDETGLVAERKEESSKTAHCLTDANLRDTQKYIGHIHHVLEKVPSHLKILSIENIMKYQLVNRFNKAWSSLSKKYEKESRQSPELYVTSPRVAFHGTRQGNVPNIVRHGLLVPGKENHVQVANGSSLGVGIYLSPYPEYSFGYCDVGGKVLICAVLPGHIINVDERCGGRYRRADCITSGNEMVIFDARHVLPCYVIKLVPRESDMKVEEIVSKTLQKTSESKEDRLKRISARAKKYFPHGFGAGERTVILDAAMSDDDEDEGGMYQQERYEIAEVNVVNEYSDVKDNYESYPKQ